MRLVFQALIITCTLVFLSACSSITSGQLFSNYTEQLTPARNALQSANMQQAASLLPTHSANNVSNTLGQLENARVSQLSENYTDSKVAFENALYQIDKQNFAANIEISEGLQTTASFLTNDNVRDYRVPYFEQTMVHTLQSLNYVALNNVEGALVEVRRANLVQQQALKKNQNELEKAVAKTSLDLNDLYSRYPTMDDMIGSVKNGFQNAFTFYLSGFLYEATGEYNAAYIDYKRAIDIYSENTYLQQDILRLAKYLGFDDEYNYFKARFNADLPLTKNNQVRVLVLIEQGLIPEKTEARIDLPIFTSRDDIRFYSVALPSYANNHEYAAPLSINIGEQTLQSETIVKLSALAAKDLKERMPGIVARQITRLIAKEQFRKSAARNGGDVGNIIATLYNLASERADTRSWLTLANNYQIAKTYLTSGEHTLSINLNGITHPVSFSTDGNKSVLIKVVNLGSTLNTTVYTI
ncbi:COG3014 family protein [Pseudoalteromonas sp. XMcav1-K]|uniref:COG3014 family protein n=1 Tax=Pseudoalteromonas sp. XMcav1-K TaxID=3374372 RepID=UPI003756A969